MTKGGGRARASERRETRWRVGPGGGDPSWTLGWVGSVRGLGDDRAGRAERARGRGGGAKDTSSSDGG